jgi:biopolymer transport protein ExbD/biopolymer transport protein TolR
MPLKLWALAPAALEPSAKDSFERRSKSSRRTELRLGNRCLGCQSFVKEDNVAITVRNEGAKVNSNINVTPMVDVMLVLLIIFMVVTPMLRPGPPVDLAKTNNPLEMRDAEREDAVLVAINREGRVFLGNQQIAAAELSQKIQDRLAGRSDKRVFVKADARSRYRAVAEVIDHISTAGVSDLGLLTERRRQ